MVTSSKTKSDVTSSTPAAAYPDVAAIIPIMNSPIFPGMIAPIVLGEDKFAPALDQHLLKTGHVALNLVKFKDQELPAGKIKGRTGAIKTEALGDDEEEEELSKETKVVDLKSDAKDEGVLSKDIYKVGVLCKVLKKLRLPDGSVNILVQGIKRYRVIEFIHGPELLLARIEVFEDIVENDEELDAYVRSVINQVKRLSEMNPYFNEEMKLAMLNPPSPGALADLVAFALSMDIPEAQDFIETLVVKKRFAKLLVYLKREKEVADIQKKITDEVNDKVNKYQREYFLREQLKVIRQELGLDEDDKAKDLKKIKEGIEAAKMPEEAKKAAQEELERLENISEQSPEYNVSRTYLYWLIQMPWSKSTQDNVEMATSKKILARDHYGLEKPKQRILEFLAVRKLRPAYEGTILCFAGPPGTGKTSLGQSIARSLGRKFHRFSLGGMKDEAEIKGHRRTYVGAMPGKIIQALKRVEVNNPVIMLDEIDKLGKSFQGDPASALLEVLDPEQNVMFVDNYLDVAFDLSKVLFIATANYIADIPEPLLDRMEVIELSGYTIEEKLSIARIWVIPKQLKKHGLSKTGFVLSDDTLKKLISDYSREPGVRSLEQHIAKLCRQAALEKVSVKKNAKAKKFSPRPNDLEKHLGGAKFETELADKVLDPGIVIGLAWTALGGSILSVETIPLEGEGFKLTGQLGNVMNESATLAYSFVKSILQRSEIKNVVPVVKNMSKGKDKTVKPPIENTTTASTTTPTTTTPTTPKDFLSRHQIHLHLPAGATPKDGPSAGITMATALYGLATGKRVKPGLAMTGELSLTGKVLPVGGVKEKVLAAKRAGLREIILPFENQKDLKEVPERHRKGLIFHPVKRFEEVLKVAFGEKN